MSMSEHLCLFVGFLFLEVLFGDFRDNRSVMMIVDNPGDLSIFWIAHNNEQEQCTVTSKGNKFENFDNGYKDVRYTSGVVVKDMILVCGGMMASKKRKSEELQNNNTEVIKHPCNRCWYWHKDQPPSKLRLLGEESSIPVSENNIDPESKGRILMASTFINGNYIKDDFDFFVLVLATFNGIKSKEYQRHFFGAKVNPNCTVDKNSQTNEKLTRSDEVSKYVYEKPVKQKQNASVTISCAPKINWTPLATPNWGDSNGVEFPCAVYYGKHLMVIGVSQTLRMPEWGAIYYDSKKNEWKDFKLDGQSTIKIPGRPRNHFACGIYRNNLMFNGGLFFVNEEEKFESVANDTHLFNIRYHDTENPWNAQYTIPPMDDGNGNECEVCPLWGHSITIIQDANREVMLAGYGYKDTKSNGNGNIYQFDQTYGMSQGEWTVERESPRFLGWVENYFGLTVPMKWIKQCAKENKGTIRKIDVSLQIVFGYWFISFVFIDMLLYEL